jgi:hypothetical protein
MIKRAWAMIIVLMCCCSGQWAEAVEIPGWVRQNTVVVYDFVSAALQNGVVVSGGSASATEVFTVTGVSATAVSGIAQITSSGIVNTNQFTCTAAGACSGPVQAQFAVDPTDPTHSTFGPNGEVFTIIGTSHFTVAGVTWNAVTMAYSNAASGVEYVTIFDTNSGLILQTAEYFPTEEIIQTLHGFGGAVLPTAPPTTLLSSGLPSSRSVQVGKTATAFVSVINAGSSPGMACGLADSRTRACGLGLADSGLGLTFL